MVKNRPANAGGMGSIPGSVRFHAAGQLSPCTTTLMPMLKSPRSTVREVTTMGNSHAAEE